MTDRTQTTEPGLRADLNTEAHVWQVFREGYDAWSNGTACPYPEKTPDWHRWRMGNWEAERGYPRS